VSVEINDQTVLLKEQLNNNIGLALRMMLEETYRESNPITPKRQDPVGGTLRTAVTKTMESNTKGTIAWHAPYAYIQERGWNPTTNGKTYFTNYTTPGTHAHFAEESVKKVVARSRDILVQAGAIR